MTFSDSGIGLLIATWVRLCVGVEKSARTADHSMSRSLSFEFNADRSSCHSHVSNDFGENNRSGGYTEYFLGNVFIRT